jgi:hypothetical protein
VTISTQPHFGILALTSALLGPDLTLPAGALASVSAGDGRRLVLRPLPQRASLETVASLDAGDGWAVDRQGSSPAATGGGLPFLALTGFTPAAGSVGARRLWRARASPARRRSPSTVPDHAATGRITAGSAGGSVTTAASRRGTPPAGIIIAPATGRPGRASPAGPEVGP